jgi:hypothetical protein
MRLSMLVVTPSTHRYSGVRKRLRAKLREANVVAVGAERTMERRHGRSDSCQPRLDALAEMLQQRGSADLSGSD